MKKNKIHFLKFTSLISLLSIFLILSCSTKDFSKAESVIKKIEQYKKSHSKLPNSLVEIGIDNNSGPVYYDKINEVHYQMFYQIETEEIWTYNTVEKKWKDCPECVPLFKKK